MNVSYDLNFIADQDGTVDNNCTRAFINKIVIKEQFGYPDCLEDNIQFATFLEALLSEVATWVDSDILTTMSTICTEVYNHPATIKNSTVYKTMDITTGLFNFQKTVKAEVFQFQSILLNDVNRFLESFEIECTKDPSGLTIKIKAKVLTLSVLLTKLPGNIEDISLAAACE